MLTRREEFAKAAMQALVGHQANLDLTSCDMSNAEAMHWGRKMARVAIAFADTLEDELGIPEMGSDGKVRDFRTRRPVRRTSPDPREVFGGPSRTQIESTWRRLVESCNRGAPLNDAEASAAEQLLHNHRFTGVLAAGSSLEREVVDRLLTDHERKLLIDDMISGAIQHSKCPCVPTGLPVDNCA